MITKSDLEDVLLLKGYVLYWKEKTEKHIPDLRIRNVTNTKYAGKPAGCIDDKGYVRLRLFGKGIRAHRIIWCMTYGEWPADGMDIDHIDGDRLNNDISNLRVVSKSINARNRHTVRSDSKTGLLGVRKIGNVYNSRVWTDNGRISLGCFKTPEDAHNAYAAHRMMAESRVA
jgi:hypothetical protein